jgi:hypothetical protein
MSKNEKVFFEVNFEKEMIGDYIRNEFETSGEEITDDRLEQLFVGILNRIVEEGAPDTKTLYLDKNYKYIQFKIVGLREEPKENNITMNVSEDSIEIKSK